MQPKPQAKAQKTEGNDADQSAGCPASSSNRPPEAPCAGMVEKGQWQAQEHLCSGAEVTNETQTGRAWLRGFLPGQPSADSVLWGLGTRHALVSTNSHHSPTTAIRCFLRHLGLDCLSNFLGTALVPSFWVTSYSPIKLGRDTSSSSFGKPITIYNAAMCSEHQKAVSLHVRREEPTTPRNQALPSPAFHSNPFT